MALIYVWSGAAGAATGADWTNAKTTLTAAFTTEVAGDTLFVAHDHVETVGGAITLTSQGTFANPTKVICVDRAGTVPPVSADRRTTAQCTVTGANVLTITGATSGFVHFDGIIFSAGSASSLALFHVGTVSTTSLRFDNCSLRIAGTSSGSLLNIGSTSAGGIYVELNNTTVSFGAVGQSMTIYAMLKWRATPSALLGTIPTVLMIPAGFRGGSVECIGVDFSAAGSGKTIAGNTNTAADQSFKFVDCKLNASVTKSAVPAGQGATEVDYIRSGSAGVNYAVHRHRIAGLLIEETTIVRTGGATDGTTAIAWKIDTTANCTYSLPFECPPIAIWNDTTGSAVTATVEGIWGGGAVPLDDEVWLDVEYLGDASSPQGSFVNDGKANLLATAANQTSSSETWGGSTTKFKLACTFTPQMKGWCYCRVKVGRASSTFYVDPLVTLT